MKDDGLIDENKEEEELPQQSENEESVIGTMEKCNLHYCQLLIIVVSC